MQLTQRNLFLGYFFYMETDTTWYHLYFISNFFMYFLILFLKNLLLCLIMYRSFLVDPMTESSLYSTANMPITSHFVVSSIPYHHCNGSSLPAVGCCFTSWCTNARSSVSNTGMWVSLWLPFSFFLVVHSAHFKFVDFIFLIIFSLSTNFPISHCWYRSSLGDKHNATTKLWCSYVK